VEERVAGSLEGNWTSNGLESGTVSECADIRAVFLGEVWPGGSDFLAATDVGKFLRH